MTENGEIVHSLWSRKLGHEFIYTAGNPDIYNNILNDPLKLICLSSTGNEVLLLFLK